MGKFLSKYGGASKVPSIPINLDGSEPDDQTDQKLVSLCVELEGISDSVIQKLQNYQGCTSQVRKAILNPKSDIEKETLAAIKPAVLIITDCYISTILNQCAMKLLLLRISSFNEEEITKRSPALLKHLVHFTEFMYEFDRIKATKPEIQNDFSYYRRTFNASKDTNYKAILPLELTDNILLFFASAYPTITRFRTTVETSQPINDDLERLQGQVTIIKAQTELTKIAMDKASILISIVHAYEKEGLVVDFSSMQLPVATITNGFTQTISVGKSAASKKLRKSMKRTCVVMSLIYDALDTNGLVGPKSMVPLKPTVKALKSETLGEEESLLAAIRYNGKGLYTPSTPKALTNLLTVKKK